MTVDTQHYCLCQNRFRLGNISFQASCSSRKSGLCDGSFFNAVGKRVLVWVGGGGVVFQHCTRQAYAKITLLRVVHYWYFSFTARVCVMHTMGGGWLVFRRSSLFFFVLPLRFCSLHFNNDVHFYVCTAKRRGSDKGFSSQNDI